jgi:hypothetical protein
MPYGTPSRFPFGVTNSGPFPANALGNYRAPLPMGVPVDFDDFMGTYAAADWTVTAVGTSTAADTAGLGGLLLLTTGGTTNNLEALQRPTAKFAFVAGNQFWFAARFKLDHATLSRFMIGMGDTFAAVAPATGVYFHKASGAAALTLDINGPSATTSIPIATTLVANTWYGVAFYYDGRPEPKLYAACSEGLASTPAFGSAQEPFPGGQIVAAAGATAAYSLANLPTTDLTMGFGVLTSSGAARTATIDYVFGAAEAVRQ